MMDKAQQEKYIREAIVKVFEGADSAARRNIFLDLKRAYGDHRRHHHGILHIAEMIAESDRHETPNRRAFLAAILFHDFVYKPERYNKATYKGISNEQESAAVCERYLMHYKLDSVMRKRAYALIRMTENHKVPEGDKEAALLMDIDMAVLGAKRERYETYARGTAKEFMSAFSPTEYRAGRAQFLDNMRGRETIFLTPQYKHLEPAARDNMRWERDNLLTVIPDHKMGQGQQFALL